MNFGHTKVVAALALLLTLPVAACESGTSTEHGSVSIQLTDAPGESVVEAWVTITDIYLQQASGEEDPETGRVYLLEDGAETQELLSLANDVADLVSGQTVPAGSYGQLRIVISEGCIVTDDGSVYASSAGYGNDHCDGSDGRLEMPSYEETGIKVLLNGVEVTGNTSLLLDFDVSQSFGKAAGRSGTWVMSPVIHGAEVDLTSVVVATLAPGTVTLPDGFVLGDFSATLQPATGDSARVAFTDDDEDGIFEAEFRFLVPDTGPFEVRLNWPGELTGEVDPTSPVTADPASGETARVDWVLQSATAEGDDDVVCPPWVCG